MASSSSSKNKNASASKNTRFSSGSRNVTKRSERGLIGDAVDEDLLRGHGITPG